MFSIAPAGDFLSLVDQLTFNPGSGLQRDCATITVGNNTTLEDDESFSVVLTTTDSDVIISQNTAVVTITNDDSKYLCLTSLVITITNEGRWLKQAGYVCSIPPHLTITLMFCLSRGNCGSGTTILHCD